jgi:hypothetical protein
MQSIADLLPPEVAKQIHPNWRKNEADYWAVREELLGGYRNRWIAFADGEVIVAGTKPNEVMDAAFQSGRHPFVTCVGRETEPSCRFRSPQLHRDIPRTSIADLLPPEIAKQVHPDWRKNEAAYWAMREELLGRYRNQWIAFDEGKVIASGTNPLEVFKAADEISKHSFVTFVGRETEPSSRIRKVAFPYDTGYPGAAMPRIDVEFRERVGTPGVLLDSVIPDSGADMTVLPWADCQALQLDPAYGRPDFIGGVTGSTPTLKFQIWARLDGQDYPCSLKVDFSSRERILGRDVLNCVDVLFRGPAGQVVINP